MVTSDASQAYAQRARKALAAAQSLLAEEHLEAAVSRAYYACFYAMHAQLEALGESAASHKQTAIIFRKYFIKTELLPTEYSLILRELTEWRTLADYAADPALSCATAENLVAKAVRFVDEVLATQAQQTM